MVTGLQEMDSGLAVRRINDNLQGPVVEILSQFVPDLKRLPPGQAYERTLDDINLLQRCFEAFRAQRDKFKFVLVDADRQPVTDDTTRLSCGRTLDQVVAMIVRTAAKRYFRRKLNVHHPRIGAPLREEIHAKGFAHRVAALFHETPKHKPAHVGEPARGRAEELYDAIKARLLHEWQVPLVPTYADMTPSLVRALGDKLLDIRSPEELRRIVDDPAEGAKLFDIPETEAVGAGSDALAASAGRRDERARLSDVLSPDGKRLRVEAFSSALLRPDVRAELKLTGQMLKVSETLRRVGGLPAKLLVAELGLRVDQLAVFLLVAYETMGPEVFDRIFGQPGEIELLMRVTQKARLAGLCQRSALTECSRFVRETFARFHQTAR